jgi:hypothetical protein
LISGDVLNGVGCGLGGVEHDIADKGAVEEGCDAEIEVSLRAGDGGAKIGGGITDVDVGGLSPLIAIVGESPMGDYLLNYIDNLIVLWINDDDLTAHHKEQVGLDPRYLGGHIRRHRMERDRF